MMVGRRCFPFGFWCIFRGELLNFGWVTKSPTNKQRKNPQTSRVTTAVTSTSQCNSSHHQAQTGQSNGGFGVVKPEDQRFLFFLMGIWRAHPWKLTWHCRITFFNRRYIFIQWSFFHCHVSFRECTPNATPSALRILPDCFDALEKSVSTNWGFFSCDEIPLVGNITNLPQRNLWWNAILP